MATDRQRAALQTIFSFFLGIMVLALVGVGVNTFYPTPASSVAIQKQLDRIGQQQGAMQNKAPQGTLSVADQAELDRLQKQMDDLNLKMQVDTQAWTTNTSIVLVIFATIVMAISLVLSETLRVLANGLLLGGLFTMIYGIGWAAFGGTSSYARFAVILFALVVSIGLGYVKFVRGRKQVAVDAGEALLASEAFGGVEARLAALEARVGAAAAALGAEQESPTPPVAEPPSPSQG